ncbi:MAG: cobalt-precorrin-4 methyltransferase [Cellulosilyticaceae bacterium]
MNKVYFVGAGPGNKELITLKGYNLLCEADIVIYAGSLVNPELLSYCKADCEIYDSASMYLEQIIEVMVQGVKQDKKVVRLQTGDCAIYGSIREQIEALIEAGISYESIPGVSSFLGAAASLGVEYTVPQVSQSVIITRAEGRTPVPEREALRTYAQHQTSMVIFLSVQMIEKVVSELVAGGYGVDTPVAVVYKATWADEEILRGTLETIKAQVEVSGIHKTALIMVGKFLGHEYYNSQLYHKDFAHEYRS